MKRIIFASLLFFFCAIPNALAFSGVIGVSPSEIHLQVEKGETVESVVHFQRAFPNADEVVLLEVDGENNGAVTFDAGAKATLSQGEQTSLISFSVDAAMLEAGVHEFITRITGEEPVSVNDGPGLSMGVGVRVIVTVVDPEVVVEEDEGPTSVAYSEYGDLPPEIVVTNIERPEYADGKYSGTFFVRNETDVPVYGVPYSFKAERLEAAFSLGMQTIVPGLLEPGMVVEVPYAFEYDKAGSLTLTAAIGSSSSSEVYSFGFLGVHASDWFKIAVWIVGALIVLLLAVIILVKTKKHVSLKTVAIVLGSIILCAAVIYVVRDNFGTFTVVGVEEMRGKTTNILMTDLEGMVSFTQLSDGTGKNVDNLNQAFALSSTTIGLVSEVESEEQRNLGQLVLLQYGGVTKAALGEYHHVKTLDLNNRNTHMLVHIQHQEESEYEYCLVNTFLSHEGCLPYTANLDGVVEYAKFSQADGRYIELVVDGENMIHDLWFDRTDDSEEEIYRFSFEDASVAKTTKNRFLSSESGKRYLVPFGADVAELSGGGFLFFVKKDDGQDVYFATVDGKMSLVASFSSMPQEHYLFNNGISMTRP